MKLKNLERREEVLWAGMLALEFNDIKRLQPN
jgi:hypothetical protein